MVAEVERGDRFGMLNTAFHSCKAPSAVDVDVGCNMATGLRRQLLRDLGGGWFKVCEIGGTALLAVARVEVRNKLGRFGEAKLYFKPCIFCFKPFEPLSRQLQTDRSIAVCTPSQRDGQSLHWKG